MKGILFLFAVVFFNICRANCIIYHGDKPISVVHQDAVFALLSVSNSCPENVQSFIKLLKSQSLMMHTSMVANRGKNNPVLGSFSFFSSIEGDMPNRFKINKGEFFFGFFTKRAGTMIQLDQEPTQNNLLIELIAWDKEQQWFNFYELRGFADDHTRWFYRGNSQDAYLDNQLLYRHSPDDKPKFGTRMRCSGCHDSGGPIMKEAALPHNDWWRHNNPLIFAPNVPDQEVQELVNTLMEAEEFASQVTQGIEYLETSTSMNHFKTSLSLQEQLRPLFCTQEINLESDLDNHFAVEVPSGFWLNPLLGHVALRLSQEQYQWLVQENRLQFPETLLPDADHAWLTPVKGRSDLMAINSLISKGVVDRHFTQAVLMIDFKHPVFSTKRCRLLNDVPDNPATNWQQEFINNLQVSHQPEADRLIKYLSDKTDSYLQLINAYQNYLDTHFNQPQFQQRAFKRLIQLRKSVFEEELSQNPLGQILEPGFRVIFPIAIKR